MLQRVEGFELDGLLFSSSYDDYAGPENPTFTYPGRVSGAADDLDFCTAYYDALSASEEGWVFGGGIRMEGGQPNGSMFIGLGNGTDVGFSLVFTKNGGEVVATFRAGDLTGPVITNGASASTLVGSTDEWIYFECKVLLKTDATGSVELRLAGSDSATVQIINKATVKSVQTGGCRTCMFHTNAAGHFDDLWWATTTGGEVNDFLGLQQVYAPAIESIGASEDFTPEGAASNLQAVTDGDDDTYVSSGTNGAKDLYSLSDASPVTSEVKGVQLQVRGGASSLGTRELRLVMREGSGTELLSDPFFVTSVRKGTVVMASDSKPSTGPWDLPAADSLQTGYQVSN